MSTSDFGKNDVERAQAWFENAWRYHPGNGDALLSERRSEATRVKGADNVANSYDGDKTVGLPISVNGARADGAGVAIPGYVIKRLLKGGGQGVVYEAFQCSTGRLVAIKVLSRGIDRVRFEREVSALAQLRHPNIVTIHDSGHIAGQDYLVMDLVVGPPLDKFAQTLKESADPTGALLRLLLKVCTAVNAAHQRGIIHRDLKPSNILVDAAGEPHVLDFGLAKLTAGSSDVDPPQEKMTVTGQFVGSLPWASPEQAAGDLDGIDIRTDVYSLGVILYQLLTNGRFPYDVTGSPRDVLNRIVSSEPARLHAPPSGGRSAARSPAPFSIDGDIEIIVLKCLAKEPTRRYQSASELGRDLERTLNGEPIESRRDSMLYVLRKRLRRYRAGVGATLAFVSVLLAALCLSLWLYARERHQHQLAEKEAYIANIAAAHSAFEREYNSDLKRYLHACPQRFRGWEWGFLNSRADNSRIVLSADQEKMRDADFDSTGSMIVTVSDNRFLRVYDVVSGTLLQAMQTPFWDNWVTFAPDNTYIVTTGGSPHYRTGWHVASGRQLYQEKWSCFGIRFYGERFTPVRYGCEDGTTIFVSRHDAVHISARADGIKNFELSPTGCRAAISYSDQLTQLWDTASDRLIATLEYQSNYSDSALSQFSTDGSVLASRAYDSHIWLWNATDGGFMSELTSQDGTRVICIAVSRDGRRVAAGLGSGKVQVWDTTVGQTLAMLPGRNLVYHVEFSCRGERLLVRDSRVSRVWDIPTGTELTQIWGAGRVLRMSPDGATIANIDKEVRLWDVKAIPNPLVLRGHQGNVNYATFSDDGLRVITASDDCTARIWSVTGEQVSVLGGHDRPVTFACFCADGRRVLTLSGGQSIDVWDCATKKKLMGWRGSPTGAALSPDGDRIVTAHSRFIRILDVNTGKMIAKSEHSAGRWTVYDGPVAFSRDGQRIAAVGVGGLRVHIFDASNAKPLGDDDTRGWCWVPGRTAGGLGSKYGGGYFQASLSPDGSRVVTSFEDAALCLWEAQSGRPLVRLSGHTEGVSSCMFSRDGTRIVTASDDDTSIIWDSVSWGQRYRELEASGPRP